MRRSRGLAAVIAAALCFAAGSVRATTLFTVDSSTSNLGVIDGGFRSTAVPPFVSTLEPTDPFGLRPLAGTFEADPNTGELVSATVPLLGDPIVADQIVLNPRGIPVDIGDLVLSNLVFHFDAAGIGTITGGTIEFDLSLGSSRIRSLSPISLAGVTSSAANMGAPPFVTGSGGSLRAVVPFFFPFQNLPVINGGLAEFSLLGTVEGPIVPEPATFGCVAFGLLALGWRRRAGSRR